MIKPKPFILIDGVEIPAGLDFTRDFASVVASGFAIQWGRSDYMDQPQAGSMSVTLYDKSGLWSTSKEIIGLPITAGMWWDAKQKTLFRGRITDATLTVVEGSDPRIFALSLSCTDKIGELGQTYVSDVRWPAENYSNRAARIMAAGGNKIVAGIAGGGGQVVEVLEIENSSLLELTQMLIESAGDRMAYDPETNRIETLGRLKLTGQNLIRIQLDDSGLYGVGLNPAEGPTVGANTLTTPGGLSRSISSGITEVRVMHTRTDTGSAKTYNVTSSKLTGLSEEKLGRRVLTVQTQMYDLIYQNVVSQHEWIDYLLDLYVSICKEEGQQWVHPPVTWDSRYSDGFRSEAEMFTVLRCTEVRLPVHFQNSIYNSVVSHVPVYRIIGGTTEYIGGPKGGWVSTINPGPVYVSTTGTPVTWSTVNTSSSNIIGWKDLDRISGWGSYAKATQGVI
ncbi:hypothetical protein [Arthrobacter alpinus]|uniref:hypothetical protein n=1 Tax=Arthrobacter alpinus TaxID=656366 RepID=UPI0016496BEE|nr:hypothetical protein [Arthrobacter alpinus]